MKVTTKKQNPLWGLSFRPFFLFGSIISALMMFIWIAFQIGWFNFTGYYSPVTWHAHEMIFGFAGAIVTGFLFTASANWSGKKGLHGKKLQILFFTWLAARFIPILCNQPNIMASVIDLAFFPLVIFFLIPYLGIKEQRKNQVFFFLFGILFLGNLLIHLETLGISHNLSRKGIMLGLSVIIMMITVIGGRVFPFFTKKAVKNARIITIPSVERLCLLLTFTFIFSNSFFEMTIFNSVISLLAAIFHSIRFSAWHPFQTKKIPILWILFIGYFWLITGFILKGLVLYIDIAVSISTHAFTIGAIGVLIYGMISRVSLGHTGREIRAGNLITFAYIILNCSVLIRVFLPIITPEKYTFAIFYSGCLWIIAYSIFVFRYWNILTTCRPDGKEG